MYIHFQGRILASKTKKFEFFSQTSKTVITNAYVARHSIGVKGSGRGTAANPHVNRY
jgi:hypothetical protein